MSKIEKLRNLFAQPSGYRIPFDQDFIDLLDEAVCDVEELQGRILELECAIRLHRTKVQLVQTEDMELWAHLNDGEQ